MNQGSGLNPDTGIMIKLSLVAGNLLIYRTLPGLHAGRKLLLSLSRAPSLLYGRGFPNVDTPSRSIVLRLCRVR